MTSLPAADSPIWDQMEEDVAEERWPLPLTPRWLSFWYAGPSRVLRRMATLRDRIHWRLNGGWSLALLLWSLLSSSSSVIITFTRAAAPGAWWRVGLAYILPLGLVACATILGRRAFDREFRAYLERPGARQQASAVFGHADDP